MVLETKSMMESGVISAGHRYSASRLAAQITPAGYISEITGGLEYLNYIRALAKRVDTDFDSIKADLHKIRSILLNQNGTIVNITADKETTSAIKGSIDSFLSNFN